jgi:hypothetical protein
MFQNRVIKYNNISFSFLVIHIACPLCTGITYIILKNFGSYHSQD